MSSSSEAVSPAPSTRDELREAVERLCRPLLPYYSEGKARLRLGATGSGCPAATAELEGFSRALWGLAPYVAGGGETDLWDVALEGIRHGADPAHPEYWGAAADYDQKLVEMAAFGCALAVAPDRVWAPLSEAERDRLYDWLRQIELRRLHDCNWLLFQVIVGLGFRAVGRPYDRGLMERNLDRIESFALADGWYADGPEGHCDYYTPYAIHFACLMYAALMEREDPERCERFKARASAFARRFAHWFASDGSAVPFGRSLTYRFAQASFWGALVFAGVEPFPTGTLKGLLMRHVRWWLRQPIFHADGTLSIGYAYPNLTMAENYNAPGSPYWALTAFLPLALPAEHPFWLAEEMPLPPLAPMTVDPAPGQIVVRQDERRHIVLFNGGHRSTNDHTHAAAKYEKFAYSNAFGFSVPRGEWGLGQGAFDSMLALSEAGDNLYRAKRRTLERRVLDGGAIYARWRPWPNVEVRTWLIAGAPWHVRVHCIAAERALDVADGGFALGLEGVDGSGPPQLAEDGPRAVASTACGASGVVALYGGGVARLIAPNANTNLLHPRTVIPTVLASLPPGTHWLATAVYGQPEREGCMDAWDGFAPTLDRTDREWIVRRGPEDAEGFRIAIE